MAIPLPPITLSPLHTRTLVRALEIYQGNAVLPHHHLLVLRNALNATAQSGKESVTLTPTSARTAETLLTAAMIHAGKHSRKKFAHTRDALHDARRFGGAQAFADTHTARRRILPPGDITGTSIAQIAQGLGIQLRGLGASTATEDLVRHAHTLITTLVVPLSWEVVDRIDAISFSASHELCPLFDMTLDLTEDHPQRFSLDERARASLHHAAFPLHGKTRLVTSAREVCAHWFNDDAEQLARALFPQEDGTRTEKLSRMLMGYDTLYVHGSSVVALGYAASALRIADYRKQGAAAEHALALINGIEVQHGDPLAEHARLWLIYEAARATQQYIGNHPASTCFTAEQLALFQHHAREGLKALQLALTASPTLTHPSPPQKPRPMPPSPRDSRTLHPPTGADEYPPDQPDPQSA